MSKLNKIKTMLQNILVETFNQVSTDSGVIVWASEGNLPLIEEQVWGLAEDGSRVELADKDYVTEDGTVISVVNSVVVGIVAPSTEPSNEAEPENNEPETPANEEQPESEEPSEEQPTEEPETQPEPNEEPESNEPEQEESEPEQTEPERNLEEEVARLERENGELRERIAELENRIKELENESAGKPAEEEFKEIAKITKTGNKQLDNLARIINSK